ncbi:unnamed protein product, partial [Effrenium voratum]
KALGVPRRQQRLISGLRTLRDSESLADVLKDSQVTFARVASSALTEEWIQRVRRRSTALARAPEEVKKDHEVVLAAIQRDTGALTWAAPELLNDRDFALAVTSWQGEALQHLPATIKADKAVVLAAVSQSPSAICYASLSLMKQRDFLPSSQAHCLEEEVAEEGISNWAGRLTNDRRLWSRYSCLLAHHGESQA